VTEDGVGLEDLEVVELMVDEHGDLALRVDFGEGAVGLFDVDLRGGREGEVGALLLIIYQSFICVFTLS
jgi:hypothetical protein